MDDGSYWQYGYDALGQVTSAKKRVRDNTWVPGQQFVYAFDTIGNRTSTQAGGDQNGQNLRQATYTVNALNQITSRTVPGAVDVTGLTLENNPVSVNGHAAWQKWDYFRKQLTVDNSTAPQWQGVTVSAPGQTTVSGSTFVPQTPEGCTYDLDGNLLTDGRWNYTWDA
jgi:hypothetical protein